MAMQELWSGGVERWSLRLRMFLFFALIAIGGVIGICLAVWFGYSRFDSSNPGAAFVLAAGLSSFLLLGLTAWIWLLFDENVAKPVIGLASDLRARAHTEVNNDIDHQPARYLGDLGPAALAVATGLTHSRTKLTEAIERERARVVAERARLEAVLRDAPAACLLCTTDHRVSLFNKQAIEELSGVGEVGLGRSVFEVLRQAPIEEALQRLKRRNARDATDLLCPSKDGQRMFQARMRLCGGEGEGTDEISYVLSVRDVTDELVRVTHREALLRDVFDELGPPAAQLRRTIDTLREVNGSNPPLHASLQSSIVSETDALAQSITMLSARYAAQESAGVVAHEGGGAAAAEMEALRRVEPQDDALDDAAPHEAASPCVDREAGRERSVFFDFDLLAATPRDETRLLRDETFVVFDTETTGLFPHKGDEIVQIAGVRIVNGRVLPDERFDTLVNPERAIPASATAIHGVTDQMVARAPTIGAAGREFHKFCGSSLLVAHNARFDLAFLHRHREAIGAGFDQPVLDTVLMSAVLFGRSADHSLDVIAERLDVELPDDARHTALGDALATAEAAIKMIAMLEGRGVATMADFERVAEAHLAFLERGSTG